MFDRIGDELHGPELARTVAAPTVTHLKFAKRGSPNERLLRT